MNCAFRSDLHYLSGVFRLYSNTHSIYTVQIGILTFNRKWGWMNKGRLRYPTMAVAPASDGYIETFPICGEMELLAKKTSVKMWLSLCSFWVTARTICWPNPRTSDSLPVAAWPGTVRVDHRRHRLCGYLNETDIVKLYSRRAAQHQANGLNT